MLKKLVRAVIVTATAIPLMITNVPNALADSGYLAPSSDLLRGFTPVGSSDHWRNVDDSLYCNGLGDYNADPGILFTQESYTIQIGNIPNGTTITGVDIWPCMSVDNNSWGDAYPVFFLYFDGVKIMSATYYVPQINGTTPINYGPYTYATVPFVKTAGSQASIRIDDKVYGWEGIRLSRVKVNFRY